MDVFHVLLGIPWQFDRNVMHDGRKNTYTLENNGRRHMLFPIEDKNVKEEAIPSILLMSGKELLNEFKWKPWGLNTLRKCMVKMHISNNLMKHVKILF
jgi:hypothetical protein